MGDVLVGFCGTCGLKLVQTPERTYHPAIILKPDEPCPALIPIDPDTPELGLSFDVPEREFNFVREAKP